MESVIDIPNNLEALSEASRQATLAKARRVVAALESPEEVGWRMIWESGAQRGCIRVAIDLGIFEILAKDPTVPMSTTTLAERCGAEEEFLARILRPVASANFITEAGPSTYRASAITMVMSRPGLRSGFKISNDHSAAVENHMHEYFKLVGYKSPVSKTDGPFQWHFRTEMEYFDKIHASEEYARDFDIYMANMRLMSHQHWSTWFPVQKELFSDPAVNADTKMLVDVGGGGGHEVASFLRTFPEAPGRFFVQDLPHVVASNKYHARIEAKGHDIFKPQPIRGAKVYYTRIVLHNWSDDDCRIILGHLRDAMKPGFSRILLNELVIPDVGCSASAAAADIHMMVGFGGKERTAREWHALAESVGLRVHKIWQTQASGKPEYLVDMRLEGDKADVSASL